MKRNGGGGGSSDHQRNEEHILFPKPDTLDIDNAAAAIHVKSLLIDMGFRSTLVQKAIDENGQDDLELLLEILTKTTVTEHPQPSFHGLMEPKPEPDIEYEADGARMMLLTMKFPQNLVDFALERLGKDAPIDEMVDFIVAAQLAEKYAQESEDVVDGTEINEEYEDVIPIVARKPEVPNESLFEKMDKTLRLLEMGFSNHEISMAIEKIGTEGQISDLAESIVSGEVPCDFPDDLEDLEKFYWCWCPEKDGDVGSSSGTANVGETSKGKRLKDEDENAYPDKHTDFDNRRKRLRPGYLGDSSSFMEIPGMQDESKENTYELPSVMQPRLSQMLRPDVAKRPYFFYGNLGELSPQWWSKISSFLYGIHPEHVDTRLFSALRRAEGYVHNLPIENRFSILPKPRLTMQDTTPEHLECVMGYPANHTKMGGGGLAERLKLLDYCFQIDTLGYHLSVLKSMFPQGLTVLSLFSGIGGAEIALSRLGIHLKCVVSVEHCGLSRNILKRWWQTSRQTGELVQIEEIKRLSLKMLETLVQRFRGFDVVICQNPPTPPDL